MSIHYKPLGEISEADILALEHIGTPENRIVEYKREIGGDSDKDKREFLADVSSFANSEGGDIIYGVSAKDGIPEQVLGLVDFNEDKVKQRLESSLQTSIQPRITGIAFKVFRIQGKNPVLVLRISRSWHAPHMITFQGASRFFARNSSGKYPLDVGEIRNAFMASSNAVDRIRKFRRERVSAISRGETELSLPRLQTTSAVVLHALPLGHWDQFNFASLQEIQSETRNLNPLGFNSAQGPYLNLEGAFLTFGDIGNVGTIRGYLQLFRDGSLETVSCRHYERQQSSLSLLYEDHVRNSLTGYRAALSALGIPMPWFISLSILNFVGCRIGDEGRVIDRAILNTPEVEFNSSASVDAVLRPLFQIVWNAVGIENSPNYDRDGNWKPRNV